MRLAAEAVALEERVLHEQHAAARSAQDAFLVVVEMDVADGEIIALDPDAGAVAVAHRDPGALDAVDHDPVRLDHQRGLALDRMAAQMSARLALHNQPRRGDDGTLFVDSRRQHDPVAGQRRRQRVLQAVIAAVRLRGAKRASPERARRSPASSRSHPTAAPARLPRPARPRHEPNRADQA